MVTKSPSHQVTGIIVCLLLLAGCAGTKEAFKGVMGTSTKVLEEGRAEAIKKDLNCDYQSCFKQIKQILIERASYIYAEDLKKHMIAFYISQADTTPVGIFFKEIDSAHTEIQISSPSTFAKEFIALRLDKNLSAQGDTGVNQTK